LESNLDASQVKSCGRPVFRRVTLTLTLSTGSATGRCLDRRLPTIARKNRGNRRHPRHPGDLVLYNTLQIAPAFRLIL